MSLAYNALLRNIQQVANTRTPDRPARTLGIGSEVTTQPVHAIDPRKAQSSVKVNLVKVLADQLSPSYEGVPGRGNLTPKPEDTATGSKWYGPEVAY